MDGTGWGREGGGRAKVGWGGVVRARKGRAGRMEWSEMGQSETGCGGAW